MGSEYVTLTPACALCDLAPWSGVTVLKKVTWQLEIQNSGHIFNITGPDGSTFGIILISKGIA